MSDVMADGLGGGESSSGAGVDVGIDDRACFGYTNSAMGDAGRSAGN